MNPLQYSADAHLWRPYTDIATNERAPFINIDRGEGVYLITDDGRRILDGISSWWCVAFGHGERRIIDAIQKQAAQLQHSILGTLSHAPAIELAQRLAALTANRLPHVYFASDGSSVVDAALKMAAHYTALRGQPQKRRFIALEEAYHGDTLGAIGVGYTSWFQDPYGGLVQPAIQAPSPWTPATDPTEQLAHARRAFDALVHLVDQHQHELAGVVVEPLVQAAGGIRIYPPEYLAWLRALCDDTGLVLIADEIATGFYRTGECFACDHADITPDIMLLGKALTGGYLPMSALLATEAIYDTFRSRTNDRTVFWDGHTFTGNPICAAAALAALDCYEQDNIAARIQPTGQLLAERFTQLATHPNIQYTRTLGMIAMLQLQIPGGTGGPAPVCPSTTPPQKSPPPRATDNAVPGAVRVLPSPEDLARNTCAHALTQGLFTRPLGPVLYLWPPLTTTESEINAMCDIIEQSLNASTLPGNANLPIGS